MTLDAATISVLISSLVTLVGAIAAAAVLIIKELKTGQETNRLAIENVQTDVTTVKAQSDGILATATGHATELATARNETIAAKESAERAAHIAEQTNSIATALALKDSQAAIAAAEARDPNGTEGSPHG